MVGAFKGCLFCESSVSGKGSEKEATGDAKAFVFRR